jgi:NAD(P)H-flavin reductase
VHVQLVAGGQVSTSILRTLRRGDAVRLGAPVGDQLVLPDGERPDLLLVGAGTGLAPLRALVEQLDGEDRAGSPAPQVHLFHGVRMPWNLYERELLGSLAASRPWFSYTEVVSDDPSYPGRRGLVGSVAAQSLAWQGRTAMVCGSEGMVVHAVEALTTVGAPPGSVRYEQFTTVTSGPTGDHPREAGEMQ